MPSILKTCTLTHIRSPFAHEHGHTEHAHKILTARKLRPVCCWFKLKSTKLLNLLSINLQTQIKVKMRIWKNECMQIESLLLFRVGKNVFSFFCVLRINFGNISL